MFRKLMNRSVKRGAIAYALVVLGMGFLFGVPFLLVAVGAALCMYCPETPTLNQIASWLLLGLGVSFCIAAIVTGWFIARSIIKEARKLGRLSSGRYCALCSMVAVMLGLLPCFLLIALPSIRYALDDIKSLGIFLMEVPILLGVGGLGALGGALYYWTRGRKQSSQMVMHEASVQDQVPQS